LQDNEIKDDLKKKLLQNNSKLQDNILELISRMVNSDPEKRYQNIDDVIEQINKIQENNYLNSKIVPNHKKKYFGLLY
jgi:serine/threonine protein kinase